MAPFPVDEIRRRWEAVDRRLGEADCAVVPSFHNSYYLSGMPVVRWGRFAVTILFRGSAPALILPAFEVEAATRLSPIEALHDYRDEDGPSLDVAAMLVAEVLRDRGVRTVGVEAEGMPAAMYAVLREQLPRCRFTDISAAIDGVRIASSPEEHEYLRLASDVADAGMRAVADVLAPGILERELANRARHAMEQAMPPGTALDVACYLQQGERSVECHAEATEVVISGGQILEVVCESSVWHYQGCVERCFLIGATTEAAESAYRVMLEAFEASKDAVRPGVSFAALDRIGRDILAGGGYDNVPNGGGLVRNILHHTGGRIEAGNLRGHNRTLLRPGTVLTIEPWAIVPGVGGPRHCDMLLVTGDGHEVLTNFPSGVLRA